MRQMVTDMEPMLPELLFLADCAPSFSYCPFYIPLMRFFYVDGQRRREARKGRCREGPQRRRDRQHL